MQLTTSDGYLVTGNPSPRDALAVRVVLDILEQFTQYIEARLQTNNVHLVRHMCADFLLGQEITLLEYVHTGAVLVRVLPLEQMDPGRQDLAQRLLHSKERPTASRYADECAEVFQYLMARLATKNLSLLVDMLTDFRDHHEKTLLQFVQAQRLAINILPFELPTFNGRVFEQAKLLARPPAPPKQSKYTKKQLDEAGRLLQRHQRSNEVDGRTTDDEGCDLSASDTESEDKRKKKFQRILHPDEIKTREAIARRLQCFEQKRPWEQVFADLPLPFDEDDAPELALQLGRFWKRHSRTVWERYFWSPISEQVLPHEHAERRSRQAQASLSFRRIIRAAYHTLGVEFFARLDRMTPRHPGWWYRYIVVDLHGLQNTIGEEQCWHYVESQLYERFPDCGVPLPLKSQNSGVVDRQQKLVVSASMWLQDTNDEAQRIKNELVAYKKTMCM
ncbi:hypothetical protein Poli38472_007344 [Pythium oligandrum]|uniref:Uncharacterized protein n=1 Tax=Pythium oligandrum TaxID=41045 RepID=A0A8K1C9I5_PYTOL|nr:hypothetical protein Poli38472_007344 [Pythium oligandrum]|eukprot:TMW59199.1 hypothetical protein Poli38472_007344 [Pythium oligandrum]